MLAQHLNDIQKLLFVNPLPGKHWLPNSILKRLIC